MTKGNDGVLRRAFSYSLKWNIPFLITTLGIAGYYYLNTNLSLATTFVFIALLSPLITSYRTYASFLNGKKDFRLISIANTINSLVSSTATFLAIIFTQNPVIIVISYFIVSTLTSAFYFFFTLRKYRPNDAFESESLSRGKDYSLMNVLTIISQNIDKVLIFHFLGGSSLAIYSFAIAPVSQIQGLLKPLGSLYSPKILTKSKEENKAELPKKFFQIALIMLVVVIGYIIFIPYFYNIFFPQYSESIIYSQFYVLVLLMFGKKFIGIPTVIHLPKIILYKLSVINALAALVPKLILLYFFGLAGAIAAEIVSNVLITTVSFYYFKRM